MNRIGTRAAAVLVAGLLLGATACGGGDDSSSDGDAIQASAESSTTTADESTSGSGDLGDLSDELGDLGDLGGDCLSTSMAYFALSMAPLSFMGGASESDIAELEGQLDDLSGEIPDEIRGDFETYAAGIQAYADAMKGMDSSNILDPEFQSRMEEAQAEMETSEMEEAQANIEAYFEQECGS
jgi:hypothetical protein